MMMEPIYLHNWTCLDDMVMDFANTYTGKGAPTPDQYQGIEVLLASYGTDNYSGDAFVLFRKDGTLYEVNGGHCSCYGLEGQWEPEETSLTSLRHRLNEGRLGGDDWCDNVFKDEIAAVLDALEAAP